MNKIREIIDNFACDYHPCWHEKDYVFRSIEEGDFDKLEKELRNLIEYHDVGNNMIQIGNKFYKLAGRTMDLSKFKKK